jgi:hypothetical protein
LTKGLIDNKAEIVRLEKANAKLDTLIKGA